MSGTFAQPNHRPTMRAPHDPHRGTFNAPATPAQLAEFTAHYVAAGLQLANEELGPDATRDKLAPADAAHIATDCAKFVAQAIAADYLSALSDYAQAGTDYFLTRNGAGCGYWSRPELYGETEAEGLTELAKEAGPSDLYRGDDGLIYHYPPVSTLAGN